MSTERAYLDPASPRQFAGGAADLDGLVEADIVCIERVDPRQTKRLVQQVDLMGVDTDVSAEGHLKEVWGGHLIWSRNWSHESGLQPSLRKLRRDEIAPETANSVRWAQYEAVHQGLC